jgi:uncharacterized protein YggE
MKELRHRAQPTSRHQTKPARIRSIAAALAWATCSIGAGAFAADQEPAGITVSATGEAKVKPNRLEIEIKASAAAELTTDAVVKYRDALKHAKEAFEKLRVEKLTIEDQGVSLTGNGANNEGDFSPAVAQPAPGPGARAKQEVGISKSLHLEVTGIDKMPEEEVVALAARLLDVARDAGLTAGAAPTNSLISRMSGVAVANPMVTFFADDAHVAEEKATDEAFQQAKSKAQKLANLAGAQLGPVLSVEVSPVAGADRSVTEQMMLMMMSEGAYEPTPDRLTSYTLTEMPVRVSLRVRFAIQTAGASK